MSNKGSQPLRSKFLQILPLTHLTLPSAQPIYSYECSASHMSIGFSHSETSLSKNGAKEEEEAFLFALVFLVMMLR